MSKAIPIDKYFPNLTEIQRQRFNKLPDLYEHWNNQINVISRKDMDSFYEHHVLHSLSIAKFINFKAGTEVLDVGTGGGFPGIPLAIMFPEVSFTLVDSVGKKIKVVNEVCTVLELKNVSTQHARVEDITRKFDFVITRAVAAFPELLKWVRGKIKDKDANAIPNGIIALKGGDLSAELKDFQKHVRLTDVTDYFNEPFFETKKIVYYPH